MCDVSRGREGERGRGRGEREKERVCVCVSERNTVRQEGMTPSERGREIGVRRDGGGGRDS